MSETVNMVQVAESAGSERAYAEQSLELIQAMTIETPAELKFAVGVIAEVKEKHASVDDQRKRFTSALRKVIKDVDAFFKPALTALKSAEDALKAKIVARDEEHARIRNDLLLEAGSAGVDGRANEATALLAEAEGYLPTKVPGLSLRRSVKVEITSADAAVRWCIESGRMELLELNAKAVKELAKNTPIEIPGVVVHHTSSAAITASKVER